MRWLVVLLVACSSSSAPAPSKPGLPPIDAAVARPPKLVVLLVLDQWPQWTFVQKRPHLTKGFDRLLREGDWRTGQHPSAAVLTAPGHALLGTGEPSATSGILANQWWHREAGRVVKSIEGLDGTTGAHHLRVPALGDAVAAAKTGARAVAVSLKDRAAILPLGHAGLAVYYDAKAARMTSTAPAAWLAKLPPIKPRLAEPWTPLDPAELTGPDDHPGEFGEKGFGPTFPHAPDKTKSPADAVYAMPLGNEVVLETALAAIDGEQLGKDAVPDLLVVSLSTHDYVGHGWGHESWEAWDMTLRLDAQLERFLAGLDQKVGTWALIATSDHGAAPLPERTGSGGRITYEELTDAANRAAATQLGPGSWIATVRYPSIYLAKAARAAKERDKVVHKIILALRAFPGIELAARTVDYAGNCAQRAGKAQQLCLALDVERSGEIFFLPRRGWLVYERDEPQATTHNTLEPYDLEVPVILLAPDRVAHAAATAPAGTIPMAQIAPLVARWLGVTSPTDLPR